MQEPTPPGKTGMPRAHGVCAVVCFVGAILTGLDWPQPAPQHAGVGVAALMIWGVASLYQFLLAAGHLRTSVLDHLHLFSTSRYERRSDLGWIIANGVVLVLVGLAYAAQSDSVPLLAGQTTTLVCLLITSLISLIVWTTRWAITPKKTASA